MIDPKQVTAVVVTKGNVDLTEILRSLECFRQVRVWDNSKLDLMVYGRYQPIIHDWWTTRSCEHSYWYVQDDDCLLDNPVAICEHYEPGVVVCNMPEEYRRNYQYPEGIQLVGFGCLFDVHAVQVLADFEHDSLFLRECDRCFTALNKCKLADLPFKHLPAACAPDRLWRQPYHSEALKLIRERIRNAKQNRRIA